MPALPGGVRFQVGDRVCWTRAASDSSTKTALAGIVLAVIHSDTGLDDFTKYDVRPAVTFRIILARKYFIVHSSDGARHKWFYQASVPCGSSVYSYS
jgi:hypothetical protein